MFLHTPTGRNLPSVVEYKIISSVWVHAAFDRYNHHLFGSLGPVCHVGVGNICIGRKETSSRSEASNPDNCPVPTYGAVVEGTPIGLGASSDAELSIFKNSGGSEPSSDVSI